MDSNDDFDFDSPSIDMSRSSSTRSSSKASHSKHRHTSSKKQKQKNSIGQMARNFLINVAMNVDDLLASKKITNSINTNEIVIINGQPAKREDEESYKVINPDLDGKILYINLEGQLHRKQGPAITHTNGKVEYYFHGQLHRNQDDGPAVIEPNGNNIYYSYGMKHRDKNNKPAQTIVNPDGSKEYRYYFEDILHRNKEPAITNTKGEYLHYDNGKLHNEHGPASHTLVEGTIDKFEDQYWIHGKQLSHLQFTMLKLRNKLFKNTINDMRHGNS